MFSFILPYQTAFQEWKQAVRYGLHHHIPPEDTQWSVEKGVSSEIDVFVSSSFRISRKVYTLAGDVIQSNHPDRFALLYELFWALCIKKEIFLDAPSSDSLFSKLLALARSVQEASFSFRSSLVFHTTEINNIPWRIGFIPIKHHLLLANAAFIARQNPHYNCSVFTPRATLHLLKSKLYLQEEEITTPKQPELLEFAFLEYKTTNFQNTLQAVQSLQESDTHTDAMQFDKDHWNTIFPPASSLPETDISLTYTPALYLPAPAPLLSDYAHQAAYCQRCTLYQTATQTVFGEGNPNASLMLVGEQPGDQEDLQGRPFVGPAGNVLDHAITKAGFTREEIYLTNAVKHFKFKSIPQRRLHQTPGPAEIAPCTIWLELEKQYVKPKFMLLLGSTAAKSVLKRPVAVLKERSQPFKLADGTACMITVHPSFLLRLANDVERKRTEYFRFVADLKKAYEIANDLSLFF